MYIDSIYLCICIHLYGYFSFLYFMGCAREGVCVPVLKSFWVQFVDEVPFHGDTVTIALCKLNVKVLTNGIV